MQVAIVAAGALPPLLAMLADGPACDQENAVAALATLSVDYSNKVRSAVTHNSRPVHNTNPKDVWNPVCSLHTTQASHLRVPS